jgi:hypothetical protein
MSSADTSTERIVSAYVCYPQNMSRYDSKVHSKVEFDLTAPCTGSNCPAAKLVKHVSASEHAFLRVRLPGMRNVFPDDRISKLVGAGSNSVTLVAHPQTGHEQEYATVDLHKKYTYRLTCLSTGSGKLGLFSSPTFSRRFFNAVCSGASSDRKLYIDQLPEDGPVEPEISLNLRAMGGKSCQISVTAVTTGSEVKKLYCVATGVPVDQQTLVTKNCFIRDALTLEEQQVDGVKEIHVLRPILGKKRQAEFDKDNIVVKLVAPGGKEIQVHVPAEAIVEDVVQYALAKDKLNDSELHIVKLYKAMEHAAEEK